MKISQLLHVMARDDEVLIEDENAKIDKMTLYHGEVRGIKKDDPINQMHIKHIIADGDTIVVLTERSKR